MDILIISTTIILPLLIGYILGKNRDSDKIIFNKKLEIYTDIVYHLNSAKYLQANLAVSVEKMKLLIEKVEKLQETNPTESKPYAIDEKVEALNLNMSLLNYRNELIKLFAPARLLGSKEVVGELREYYSLISEYQKTGDSKDIEDLSSKISTSVMELEQLMRKDLGRFRALSKLNILQHINKS